MLGQGRRVTGDRRELTLTPQSITPSYQTCDAGLGCEAWQVCPQSPGRRLPLRPKSAAGHSECGVARRCQCAGHTTLRAPEATAAPHQHPSPRLCATRTVIHAARATCSSPAQHSCQTPRASGGGRWHLPDHCPHPHRRLPVCIPGRKPTRSGSVWLRPHTPLSPARSWTAASASASGTSAPSPRSSHR